MCAWPDACATVFQFPKAFQLSLIAHSSFDISSSDGYNVLLKTWDDIQNLQSGCNCQSAEGKIDFVEQFKGLFLNRANAFLAVFQASDRRYYRSRCRSKASHLMIYYNLLLLILNISWR